MPALLKETTISSIEEFARLVETTIGDGNIVWFRGVSRSSYSLKPGLFRHPTCSDIHQLLTTEKETHKWFRQRGQIFLHNNTIQEDELLFILQHYKAPTRLLDWTENPFIALYFSLARALSNTAATPTVWILKPRLWNDKVSATFKGREIPSYTSELLNAYSLASTSSVLAENPVAIYGCHNNERIVAQRGVFTIFGNKICTMEQVYGDFQQPDDCLMRALIPQDRAKQLLTSLTAIGYTDSVIYPDLEGITLEIKRKYGFEV